MGKYIVSARKYRPLRFDDVVGQDHVTKTLKNALGSEQVAHAFLFCGPRGVGKTTCARILAKAMNCENPSEDKEPCNTCGSCESFNDGASFNIIELDAASHNKVEQMRSLVEQVRFRPQQGHYKIFIIDEVHMLTTSAFNAFLKTLEEPPEYALFILATTEKHKILPTILSRCQIYDFKRIEVSDIVTHLEEICIKEGIEAEEDALHIIAEKADGALRDALSLFDRIVSFSGKKIGYKGVVENLNILDHEVFFDLVNAFLLQDVSKVLLIFNEVLQNGFEGSHFVNSLAQHLRNLLVSQSPKTVQLVQASEKVRNRLLQQAAQVNRSFLLTALDLCNQCDIGYQTAMNKALHIEMFLIKMVFSAQIVNVPFDQLLSSEKKISISEEELIKGAISSKSTKKIGESSPKKDKQPDNSKTFSKPESTEESKVTEPEPPKVKIEKKKNGSTKKSSLTDLQSLAAEVLEDEKLAEKEKKELSIENIQEIWDGYAAEQQSISTKSILESVSIELEDKTVKIKTGSALQRETIQIETGLFSRLRDELMEPELVYKIVVDPEKEKEFEKTIGQKHLSKKEIYEQMLKKNSSIKTLQQKLDLKLDS